MDLHCSFQCFYTWKWPREKTRLLCIATNLTFKRKPPPILTRQKYFSFHYLNHGFYVVRVLAVMSGTETVTGAKETLATF